MPVLVWIYGGLFVYGNSSSKFYGVDNLIEQDIILVMFNYRVGIFGKSLREPLYQMLKSDSKNDVTGIWWEGWNRFPTSIGKPVYVIKQ